MPRLNLRLLLPFASLVFVAPLAAQAPLAPAAAVPGGGGVAPETRPQKLARLYNGGLQYFEGGKYADAVKLLEEFLGMLDEAEKQRTPTTYLVLGECYYRLGTAGGKAERETLEKGINLYWKVFLQRWPADPKVPEVKTAIAQTYMTLKQWETAIEWWQQVEQAAAGPQMLGLREHSLNGQAYCYRQLKKPEEEITTLERLVYPDFNTSLSAEGAVRLMSLYALKHDPAEPKSVEFADKAVDLLKKLQQKIHLVENFIALNGIAIKLGDELLDVNAYTKALEVYWTVRPRDVVLQMQKKRIADIENLMAQQIKQAQLTKDPVAYNRALTTNEQLIKPRLDEAKKILAEFEKLPDFMPSLYFRMARCFADMNKKWEAIIVFNQLLTEFPRTPVRETVLFSRLALYADLGVAARTYALADEYLKEFPNGARAGEVSFIKAMTAMRKRDWFLGEKYLEAALKVLAGLPEDQKKLYWAEARYQLANARFLQNKFHEAKRDFDAFISEFGHIAGGKGAFMEDAEYQLALCHLFTGHYQRDPEKASEGEGAIERLTAYLAKWGTKSNYGSDAKYRLGVCHYAAYENEEAVKVCREWLETYGARPGEILQPEVYGLLGDALAALKQHKEAGDAYVESYKRATTDEVLNYSLFEAGKQYQKAGAWEAVDQLYTEFVKTRPEHPAAVTAIYWMGKAKAKLGRLEEAKELTVATLQKYIGDPKAEGIEMMISQLGEWARRRPPVREIVSADKPLPKWDAEAELARMVKPLEENANATAQFRLLYARGEMYRIGRNTDKRAAIIAEISEKAKLEELSPHLLMECGDLLLASGEIDKAEVLYRRLREDFPKSERVDAGWVGLGDVAFAKKDIPKALELYTYAIDRLGAPWKLKEALLGQARCYMELAADEKTFTALLLKKKEDKASVTADVPPTPEALLERAKKTFEEVASVREWRGESTAMALWYIAEIQLRQKKYKEATAAFERITASQGRYPLWVARAYIKAAEGYRWQGKDEEAKAKLKDFLAPKDPEGQPDTKKLEKFQGLPELDQARQRLAELGGAV